MPLVTWRMLERKFFSTEALAGSSARLAEEEPKRIKIKREDRRGRGGIGNLKRRGKR